MVLFPVYISCDWMNGGFHLEIRDTRPIINEAVCRNIQIKGSPEKAGVPEDTVSLESAGKGKGEPVKIDILHMNDVHGQVTPVRNPETGEMYGGLAEAKTVLEDERARNPGGTITLNAGDIAEGTMEAYLTKGKIITDSMNEMGFDAVALGNHDFAWGQTQLRTMVQGLDADVLAANVTKTGSDEVIDGAKPYKMMEVKGVKIGIIGLDTPTTPDRIDKSLLEGLKFDNPAETVKKYIPQVKKDGADIVVVLSHLGLEEDKQLARDVDGIDVIVGGHSHLETPGGHREGGTLVVQAGSASKLVGKVELEIDPESKKIVGTRADLIPVRADKVKPDPQVMKVLRPYLKKMDEIGSKVMGQALEDIPHAHKEAAKLNQIYSDAILEKSGADIAIGTARKLRGNVSKGDVTYKELYSVVPFPDEKVITIKATGRMVLDELENRVKTGGRGLMVPAGFKYRYDESNPDFQRVTSTTLPDGSSLDPDKWYTVVLDEGTANGKAFREAKDRKPVGGCQEIYFDYFTKNGPWKNDPDDRVIKK